jgi:hypothetical protein
MIFIDGAPDGSTNIVEWRNWLETLQTDPFFVQHKDDESVLNRSRQEHNQYAGRFRSRRTHTTRMG